MSLATSSYKYNWRWQATKENLSNSGPPAEFITGTLPDLGESAALNRNPSKAPQNLQKILVENEREMREIEAAAIASPEESS